MLCHFFQDIRRALCSNARGILGYLDTYSHDCKGPAGGVCLRTLSRQSTSDDHIHLSQLMDLHWFCMHFWLTPISMFALVVWLPSIFAT